MIGWTSPWLLTGLAAVGVPLVVHLLTRPRPVVIPFPALALLQAAGRGRQQLDRLKTVLLLLLRSMAVMAIVLAFCRPYWKEHDAVPQPGAATRVVLVIDHSMSMSATPLGLPLFARATADAAELLRNLERGSHAAIVFSGRTPRMPLPTLSPNLPLLHAKLASAAPTFEKGDPTAALAAAKTLLGGSGSIHVFSDFQRSEWAGADLRAAGGVPVYLHPVCETDIPNTAVTGVEIQPANPLPGEAIVLRARVEHFSPVRQAKDVTLMVGDTSLRQQLDLSPFSSATAELRFSMPQAGMYRGSVRIGGDLLAADDERAVRLHVVSALNVLLVAGTVPGGTGPGDFLERALDPAGQASAGIAVTRRAPARLDREALDRAAVTVLDASVAVPGDVLSQIVAHTAGGASLVCVLERPHAETVLRALQADLSFPVRLPFLPEMVAGTAPETALDPDSAQNGFLRAMILETGDALRTIHARPMRTADAAGAERDIHLRYADGTVAVATARIGSGVVVLVNCPLSPENGTVAGNPLFPVMMHELLARLRNHDEAPVRAPGAAGDVYLPQTGNEGAEPWTLRDAASRQPVIPRAEGGLLVFPVPASDRPGIVELLHGEVPVEAVVVACDPDESATRRADLSLLVSGSGDHAARLAPAADGGRAGSPRPLWHLCLFAACAALAAEMLLLLCWPMPRGRRRLA